MADIFPTPFYSPQKPLPSLPSSYAPPPEPFPWGKAAVVVGLCVAGIVVIRMLKKGRS